MLWLKRITHFNECEKDDYSGDLITYGQYYYEDDTDGLIISLDNYYELKKKKKAEEFDYSALENAKSEKQYKEILQKAEKSLKLNSLFERTIAGQ